MFVKLSSLNMTGIICQVNKLSFRSHLGKQLQSMMVKFSYLFEICENTESPDQSYPLEHILTWTSTYK